MRLISLVLMLVAGVVPAWGQVEVEVTVPREGKASLAIYEGERLVRSLWHAKPVTPGDYTVAWDGLDWLGKPLPAGEYRYRLLVTPGLRAEYLLTLGTNPGSAPYAPWPGNHGAVSSVAVDGEGMYLSASTSEVSPGIIKQSLDGSERLWERHNYEAWQGGVAMARSGDELFQLQQNGKIQVVNPANGGKRRTLDLAWPTGETDARNRPKLFALSDMDAASGQLVVCYREKDVVRWIDPADGEVLGESMVAAPSGVAFGAEGEVYVCTDDGVMRIEVPGGVAEVLIEGLDAPERLAVDLANGHLLVAERGSSHQVKRFNAAGRLLRSYGKAGGRRAEGAYDQPESFYMIADIAADLEGGFIVCEPTVAPRRTVHVSGDGRVRNVWFGGQRFFEYVAFDPADPTLVWMNTHWGWYMLVKLDVEAQSWRVLGTWRLGDDAAGLMPGARTDRGYEVYRRGGQSYLSINGLPALYRIDYERLTLTPVLRIDINITHYWDQQPAYIQELLAPEGKQSKQKSYIWTDGNGDGEPQAEEVEFSRWSVWGSGWTLAANFDLYFTNGGTVYRIPCTGWTEAGAPRYASWGEPAAVAEAPAGVTTLGGYGAGHKAVLPGPDGSLFSFNNDRAESHGWGWTGDMFWRTRLVKWLPDGTPAFAVGRHAVARPNPPGQFHNPISLLGIIHGSVIVAERIVQPASAWTTDGLYVGSFFDARAADGLPAEVYSWWRPVGQDHDGLRVINYDCLVGGDVHQFADGEVWWLAPGWNNAHLYRVSGWEEWLRGDGRVRVETAAPQARGEGTGLQATYFSTQELAGVAFERIDPQIAFDWQDGAPGDEGALPVDGFSVRWQGEVEAIFSEPYTLSAYANDGVRVWLGERLIIDGWKTYGGDVHFRYTQNLRFTEYESEPIALVAGERYPLRVEYFEGGEGARSDHGARIWLNWESPTQDRQHIPAAYLYPQE